MAEREGGDTGLFQALLPSLRTLRVSLLTGALIVSSVYVLFAYPFIALIHPRPVGESVLHLSPYIPYVLIGLLCFFVGSLYTTALEGIVDWLHRRRLFAPPTTSTAWLSRIISVAVSPISEAARERIEVEAARFYDHHYAANASHSSIPLLTRDDFVRRVIAELLWLEGKLVGTPLHLTYDQYRGEGELRLGTAILIPFGAAATCYALGFDLLTGTVLTLIASLFAIKLADYGLYYFRRAHSFLAHHIADGVVLTPSMEALKRSHDQTPPAPMRVQLVCGGGITKS